MFTCRLVPFISIEPYVCTRLNPPTVVLIGGVPAAVQIPPFTISTLVAVPVVAAVTRTFNAVENDAWRNSNSSPTSLFEPPLFNVIVITVIVATGARALIDAIPVCTSKMSPTL